MANVFIVIACLKKKNAYEHHLKHLQEYLYLFEN